MSNAELIARLNAALSLMDSMIRCGESHSAVSLETLAKARAAAAAAALSTPRERAEAWRIMYTRAVNVANSLTNYVEERPELRTAERALDKIHADALALDAASQIPPTPAHERDPEK